MGMAWDSWLATPLRCIISSIACAVGSTCRREMLCKAVGVCYEVQSRLCKLCYNVKMVSGKTYRRTESSIVTRFYYGIPFCGTKAVKWDSHFICQIKVAVVQQPDTNNIQVAILDSLDQHFPAQHQKSPPCLLLACTRRRTLAPGIIRSGPSFRSKQLQHTSRRACLRTSYQ